MRKYMNTYTHKNWKLKNGDTSKEIHIENYGRFKRTTVSILLLLIYKLMAAKKKV